MEDTPTLASQGHKLAQDKQDYLESQGLIKDQVAHLLKRAATEWTQQATQSRTEDDAIILFAAANRAEAKAEGITRGGAWG